MRKKDSGDDSFSSCFFLILTLCFWREICVYLHFLQVTERQSNTQTKKGKDGTTAKQTDEHDEAPSRQASGERMRERE